MKNLLTEYSKVQVYNVSLKFQNCVPRKCNRNDSIFTMLRDKTRV